MRIALVQTDIRWVDVDANLRNIEHLLTNVPRVDLVVLPEMFASGFVTSPDVVMECAQREQDNPVLLWMKSMARERDAAFTGSIAVRTDDGTCRNRMYFVTPEGKTSFYDKHHLFSYGGEHLTYTSGSQRTVVEWRGVRLLLQICYDLRFPVFSRNVPEDSYDVAVYVANWPQSRQRVWETLLKARAIENQSYVVGVNRVGEDATCKYSGGSMCVNAYGIVEQQCPSGEQAVTIVETDLEALSAFRKKFPVLSDADSFQHSSIATTSSRNDLLP